MGPGYVLQLLVIKKNHKIDNKSTTNDARENKNRLAIFRILEMFDVCLTNFKNNQILLDKICP